MTALEVQDTSAADATIASDRRRKADVLIVVLRKPSASEESVNTINNYVARGQPDWNHEVLDELNVWNGRSLNFYSSVYFFAEPLALSTGYFSLLRAILSRMISFTSS